MPETDQPVMPSSADPSDAFVVGPDGARHWGLFGAAGLLCWDRTKGVLLQERADWTHFGGTWGLPGGARRAGEDAVHAAFREAAEEAAVPARRLRVLGEHVYDLGYWSYTTVLTVVITPFEPMIMDGESVDLQWVQSDSVAGRTLHPNLASAWPSLLELLDRSAGA